jgi:hypothetical protein
MDTAKILSIYNLISVLIEEVKEIEFQLKELEVIIRVEIPEIKKRSRDSVIPNPIVSAKV